MNSMPFLSEVARARANCAQQVRQIVEAIHQQVADTVLALQDAVGDDGGRSSGDGAEAFPSVDVDDQVRRSDLNFRKGSICKTVLHPAN